MPCASTGISRQPRGGIPQTGPTRINRVDLRWTVLAQLSKLQLLCYYSLLASSNPVNRRNHIFYRFGWKTLKVMLIVHDRRRSDPSLPDSNRKARGNLQGTRVVQIWRIFRIWRLPRLAPRTWRWRAKTERGDLRCAWSVQADELRAGMRLSARHGEDRECARTGRPARILEEKPRRRQRFRKQVSRRLSG